MFTSVRIVLLAMICLVMPLQAGPPPVFTYESMLNMYFDDDSGLIRITNMDMAFAPEGEINAAVALVDSENTVVKSYKFYPDPRWREGVYARMSEVGPAEFVVTEPGVYNIVFLIDGKPVSRLPIAVEETSAGDDPFDPVKKVRFIGMWQVFGNLAMNTWKDEDFPELNLWLGGRDLADGDTKDMFAATLKLDGEVVAHSKETQGYFGDGHYEETEISLYHPHDKKGMVNAMPYMLSDWTGTDGVLKLDITRQSDDKLIRSFTVVIEDGKIQHLNLSALDYEPHIDYVVPRIDDDSSQNYGFVEAFWLKSE